MLLNPKISVLISVFNRSRTIVETINSVQMQTVKEIEILVVDDCSIDGTVQIIEEIAKCDERIVIIKSSQNSGGPARPRNIGIKISKAPLIAFLDSDDVWLPTKLERQIESSIERLFVCTMYSVIDENSCEISLNNSWLYLAMLNKHKSLLMFKNPICFSSVLVSRELLLDCSFDEDVGLRGVEDFYLYLELILVKNVNVTLIKEKLVQYRVHSDNISGDRLVMRTKALYAVIRFSVKYFSTANLFCSLMAFVVRFLLTVVAYAKYLLKKTGCVEK
jgi:teichuronic acid biosynthesis glycosyltransferase TuaG